jgi:hypothetical protein
VITTRAAAALPSGFTRDILTAAIWFGLVTGLGEGIGLWALQHAGWLRGPFTFLGSSLEILWIAVLVDLLVFCAMGLVLSLVSWFLPRLSVLGLPFFLFTCLASFDWLAMPLVGRIQIWAVPILAAGLAIQVFRWFRRHQLAVERFWRKSIPWLGAFALLEFLAVQGGFWLHERVGATKISTTASSLPNALAIVVDTLRADHLSSYGYGRPFFPFHQAERRELRTLQLPTAWMDNQLFGLRQHNPGDRYEILKALADRVLEQKGCLLVDLHNYVFDDALFPGWARTYRQLWEDLASRNSFWFATSGELAEHWSGRYAALLGASQGLKEGLP